MRSVIRWLVVAALGLPVVQAVLVGVGALLGGIGDERGAAVVRGVGSACLIVWTVTLVGLMLLVAIVVGGETDRVANKANQELDEE